MANGLERRGFQGAITAGGAPGATVVELWRLLDRINAFLTRSTAP